MLISSNSGQLSLFKTFRAVTAHTLRTCHCPYSADIRDPLLRVRNGSHSLDSSLSIFFELSLCEFCRPDADHIPQMYQPYQSSLCPQSARPEFPTPSPAHSLNSYPHSIDRTLPTLNEPVNSRTIKDCVGGRVACIFLHDKVLRLICASINNKTLRSCGIQTILLSRCSDLHHNGIWNYRTQYILRKSLLFKIQNPKWYYFVSLIRVRCAFNYW